MDKVKQFWKDVVREREDYWCSFFRKYEEDDKDADVNSYMDNTSNRIAKLLKLAEENDTQNENPQAQVQCYYEEQTGESSSQDSGSEHTSVEETIEAVIKQSLDDSKTSHHSLSPMKKKPNPCFVTEILDEEEELKNMLQPSPSTRKLKFFYSPPKSETVNCETPISENGSIAPLNSQTLEVSMNERSSVSLNGDSVKHVCRRMRFRSNTDVPTPKRFKLA